MGAVGIMPQPGRRTRKTSVGEKPSGSIVLRVNAPPPHGCRRLLGRGIPDSAAHKAPQQSEKRPRRDRGGDFTLSGLERLCAKLGLKAGLAVVPAASLARLRSAAKLPQLRVLIAQLLRFLPLAHIHPAVLSLSRRSSCAWTRLPPAHVSRFTPRFQSELHGDSHRTHHEPSSTAYR